MSWSTTHVHINNKSCCIDTSLPSLFIFLRKLVYLFNDNPMHFSNIQNFLIAIKSYIFPLLPNTLKKKIDFLEINRIALLIWLGFNLAYLVPKSSYIILKDFESTSFNITFTYAVFVINIYLSYPYRNIIDIFKTKKWAYWNKRQPSRTHGGNCAQTLPQNET